MERGEKKVIIQKELSNKKKELRIKCEIHSSGYTSSEIYPQVVKYLYEAADSLDYQNDEGENIEKWI